jgi:acetyl-CoA C-acetyltransferase
MNEAYIVATARSPIGRAFKGSLKDLRPDDLAAQVVGALLDKVPSLPAADIDDLLLGCGQPGGEAGFNMARVVAILAGLPSVPGTTVTRYCASSLQTARMAFHAIRAGEGHAFIAAGVETVSRAAKGNSDSFPETINSRFDAAAVRTRRAAEGGEWELLDSTRDLPDVYISMGQTAENVAHLRGVSRLEQDQFAVLSHQRAQDAIKRGFWERQITPVELPNGTLVTTDDGPRAGVTLESVADLRPVFRPNGTVTAANCCALNDGAAALMVMSDRKVAELGLKPLGRILATSVSALSPEIMGLGPVEASRRALAQVGMTIGDVDLVEINEAFAAQVLPSARDIGVDIEKLNVNGGAIALGHPFGMTGARIIATLLAALAERDKQVGLATMCVGGGQGMALLVERAS